MKLTQNEINTAEVLNSRKYNVSGAWNVYDDKQRTSISYKGTDC